MPFVNGVWIPEDDSVSTQVAALTASSSPLMKQAATRGMQVAGRRGLLNSSLAAQAGQEAIISAATPIASQDAQTIASKNLAKINNDAGMAQQRETIAASDRANLLTAGTQATGQYLDAFSNIQANDKLPAATRDAYLANILAARQSAASLAQSIYGTTLNWAT